MKSPVTDFFNSVFHSNQSRRWVLGRVSSLLFGSVVIKALLPLQAFAESGKSTAFKEFRSGLYGQVILRNSEKYELWRQSLVWQMIKPRQYPGMIVLAETVADVIRTVNFARANHYQVSVHCGGHSYNASFLRGGVIILDIGIFQDVTIDAANRTAKVQAALRSNELMEKLAEYDLAFPAAHCGDVPMGGFLLGGGLGWNGEEWGGMSCLTIREVEVVTASGELISASKDQNSELYWAVRGAGPCFFGVVISFTLELFPNPASILTSTYTFPVTDAKEVCQWASNNAATPLASVEILFIMADSPDALPESCRKAGTGKVCYVQASAFAEDEHSARAMLKPLQHVDQALPGKCLARDEYALTPIASLYKWDATAYPRWRWGVDCLWTDDDPALLAEKFVQHIEDMPSEKSSILFLFKPYPKHLDNAAFSMTGKTYVACYAIWGTPDEDAANMAWVNRTMELAAPYTKGHYINESNYVAVPARVKNSFSPSSWDKLKLLQTKYDPEKVFFTYLS